MAYTPNEWLAGQTISATKLRRMEDQLVALTNGGGSITLPARLGETSADISATDLNNLSANGFYAGNNLTNSPDASSAFWYVQVHQNRATDGYFMQTATKYGQGTSSGEAYRRFKESNAAGFTSWVRMGDTKGAIDQTLRDILNPAQRVGARGMDIGGTDLNALINGGFYGGLNLLNAPVAGGYYFYVFVQPFGPDGAWTQQTASEFANSSGGPLPARRTWMRQRQSNTWSSWTPVADSTGAIDATARSTANSAIQPAALTTALASKADLVGGVIPTSQIPSISVTTRTAVANQAARLAQTSAQVQPGDITTQSDNGSVYLLAATDPSVNANWIVINSPAGGVSSINNQTGAVTLGAADVGAVPLTGVGANTVFSKNSSNALSGLGYSTVVSGSILVQRDASGNIAVNATATNASDATSKAYVDAGDGNQVPRATAAASQVFAKDGSGNLIGLAYAATATGSTVAQRDANGMVTVGTTIANLGAAHATPRQYVDDRAGDKNALVVNTAATGSVTLTEAGLRSVTYRLTVTGALTLVLPTPTDTSNSWTATVRLIQDATGSRVVTLPTGVKWDSGTKPTLSTTANATDFVTFLWDGLSWTGFLGAKAAA